MSNGFSIAKQVYEELFDADLARDSRLESHDFFEVERAITKGIQSGNWLRKLFMDYTGFIQKGSTRKAGFVIHASFVKVHCA